MMVRNRNEEGGACTVILHVIKNSPTPSENRLTAVLNGKSRSLFWDSNPPCSGRMPSLLPLVPPPLSGYFSILNIVLKSLNSHSLTRTRSETKRKILLQHNSKRTELHQKLIPFLIKESNVSHQILNRQ